eukprot:UN12722
MCHHNFEDIYNEFSIKCHDVNTCTCFIRNYTKRNLVKNRNAYFGISYKEINFEQIMDVIHCYFLHLFDLNLLFTRNEMDCINDSKNDSKNDGKEEEKYMNGDTLKIQIMQDIINKKEEKHKMCISKDKLYFLSVLQSCVLGFPVDW